MCLILFALDAHPKYRLVLAANRDEFYARATSSLHWWDEAPDVLAGKDLEAGGSWFGIHRDDRFAAITNYREPKISQWSTSRGALVRDYLLGTQSARQYLEQLETVAANYAGFNLLLGDRDQLLYFSNRAGESNRDTGPRLIEAGIHGISNALLDSPWPKVTQGRAALAAALTRDGDTSALFALLADHTTPADASLPDTGVGLELERMLGPRFIRSPNYGTRASTLLLIDHDGQARVLHRDFTADPSQPPTEQHWTFALEH